MKQTRLRRVTVCIALLFALTIPATAPVQAIPAGAAPKSASATQSTVPQTVTNAIGNADFSVSFESGETPQALFDTVITAQNMPSPMRTSAGNGPNATADPVYGRAWDGSKTLRITGTQPAEGGASSTNLIYDGLDIPVYSDTQLSYVILPDYNGETSVGYSPANWDWDFTSQYLAVDLEFSDGTRLSGLGGTDQYGHPMTGRGQGENGHLYQKQWNLVKSVIGAVAEGKTIQKIYVCFDKPINKYAVQRSFGAYIDLLRIRRTGGDTPKKTTPVDYANIFVGNNDRPLYSRGNQWPALMMPNGFNVWAPSNQPHTGFLAGTSGNKYWTPMPSAGITSIMSTHQASTWLGDFGIFQFMPNTNYEGTTLLQAKDRRSLYNKDTMIANPSYFSAQFDDTPENPARGVRLEVTPTVHAMMARVTFPADAAHANIIFDAALPTNNGNQSQIGGSIQFNNSTFTATTTQNNAEGRSANLYIYGEFNLFPERAIAYNGDNNPSGMVTFEEGTREVCMVLSTSYISIEQAKRNLTQEIPHLPQFDTIRAEAARAWNDILGTVTVEGASEEQKIALYSSMMRTYADPLLLSENKGTNENPEWVYASPYKGNSGASRTETAGYKLYYNNGFWDTFRGSWTTYQFLTPTRAGELYNGLVQHYVDSNWLPRWVAPGGRNSMVGTSSDIIFGDAVAKGAVHFDLENAYMASLKNASVYAPNATSANAPLSSFAGRAGMDTAPYAGYTSATDKGLSWSIDNYLNDYGVSLLADALGKTDEAIYFRNTAQHFVNLWQYSGGGWFVGRNQSGAWQYPNGMTFNQSGSDSAYRKAAPYEETNAFTTAFSGFADMRGLANLYGGKEKLAERLDKLFTDETLYNGIGRDMFVDFYDTKMGQYGHGNQPDYHIPFAYVYAGQPYKTQKITREILERVYVGASFDQLFPGDQDNGSTSGWYVMAALGLYPIANGLDGYILTAPLYDKTTLTLPTGTIEITARNNSHDNVYIQSMTIDGTPYDSCFITTADLYAAKKIVFEMGPEPSDWACDSEPPSLTPADSDDVPNPMRDLTLPDAAIANNIPENDHAAAAVYATELSETNAARLFNNTNAGDVAWSSANASVYYYFPNAQTVEMVTLTSAAAFGASAPESFTLYGSNDGTAWTALETRTGIAFDWARQLKPFAVATPGSYLYYRLDITAQSNLSLSEIELMGTPLSIIDAPDTAVGQTFDVVTDNAVSTVWLRDADLNRITAVTVSDAILNADGTKTFTVTLDEQPDAAFYLTAIDNTGYEITASRVTVGVSPLRLFRDNGSVCLSFANQNDEDASVRLVIALYTPDGKLVQTLLYGVLTQIEANGVFTYETDVTDFDGYMIRAFALDADYVPLCPSVTLIN